jgi:putative membrane protein insertion efficiency factor
MERFQVNIPQSGIRTCKKIPAWGLYFFIHGIKSLFMMGSGTCRFRPTCSEYARDALIELPLHRALKKIVTRVLRCHPRGGSGYDPVLQIHEVENE